MNCRRFSLSWLFVWVALSGSFFWPVPLFAAEPKIQSIQVEGSQRIEPETVRSYLKLVEGDRFNSDVIRQSLNALFATGFFKDVSFERKKQDLVVRVVENPMVNTVSFKGNDLFGGDELEKVIRLKPRAIYNRAKTERDLAALRQAYRIKGLFLAEIEVQVSPLDNNQVDLTYQIQEGQKTKVDEVRIIGNHGLTDEQLTKTLLIQPVNWLSWFTETNTYDREKLLYDQSQLRKVYLDHGYVRVRVDSSVAELTPDRSAFLVTHTIHERARFKFGSVRITGDFDELPEADMYEVLEVTEGAWYSQRQVAASVEKLTDLIGDFGYAFLDIKPERTILDESGTVDLIFRITKGRRVYVNRIDVVGNTRTQDRVIRREITLVEGDRFSASHLRKAKGRLQKLNFFESVEVTTPPAGDSDLVNIKVKVAEQPTGTFSVGGGYSSQDSFLGTVSVSQSNFLGKGQRMVLAFTYSGRKTEYNISFTEPYFMGKELSAGFDVFKRDVDQTGQSSIKEKTYGGALHLGFPISSHLRNTISYKFTNTEIDYTGLNAPSRVIQTQEALSPYLQSVVSNTLAWNNVDSRLMPSRGRIHRLTTDISGLGGDVHFVRAMMDHHLYHPLSVDSEWVGHVRGRFGISDGFGEEIPLFERFFLGGGRSLRGFVSAGVGPRTVEGDAYGGTHFEQINTEIFFPIVGLTDKGVRGLAFLDAGYLGDWDLPDDGVWKSGSVRMATGVGVHWNSPLGPLRFTLSTPLVKESYDRTRVFDFSIGSTL